MISDMIIIVIIIILVLFFELNSIISVSRIKLNSGLIFMNFFSSSGSFKGHSIPSKAFFIKRKEYVGMYVIVLFLLEFFSGIPILFSIYVYRII